jgi:hypothetical protein
MELADKAEIQSGLSEQSSIDQKSELKRINGSYLIEELRGALNLKRGLLYTIFELLRRPGDTVKTYLYQDRSRLVKPVIFVIACSLIYTVFQQLLGFEDGYVGFYSGEDTTSGNLFNWISNNYGYTNLIIGVFVGTWIKLFFIKYDFNFYEVLVLLCYVLGVGMLFFAFFGLIESVIDFKISDKGFLAGVIYIIWAIAHFFDKRKILSYPKVILAYILGIVSFALTVIGTGELIDYLT